MENESILSWASKIVAVWGSTIATITAMQVSVMIGIIVGLLTAGYTATLWYILWRDKIVKYREPGAHTRASDSASGDLP